jgi:hypothetical protein
MSSGLGKSQPCQTITFSTIILSKGKNIKIRLFAQALLEPQEVVWGRAILAINYSTPLLLCQG